MDGPDVGACTAGTHPARSPPPSPSRWRLIESREGEYWIESEASDSVNGSVLDSRNAETQKRDGDSRRLHWGLHFMDFRHEPSIGKGHACRGTGL